VNENQLYLYLKQNVVFDLEKSTDQYCEFDCISHHYQCVFELKCRFVHYDDLMLEKMKYDSLINQTYRPLYVNSTPKGIYIFDIREIKPIWISNLMPKQTHFEQTDLIEKKYCLLNINDAKKTIKFKD